MRFNLKGMLRGRRRKRVLTFRRFATTKAQADDLATIYNRMLAPLNDAVAMLGPLYDRELDRKLQTDSIDELGATIDAMGEAIKRLVLTLTPDLRDWALRIEERQRASWVSAVLDATGVNIDTLIGPIDARETVDAFLQRNTALVRDVGEQARGRIADAVFRGFQSRTPPAEVSKQISEAVGMARSRARRIASHQASNLGQRLVDERRQQAGLDQWMWVHSHKLHPRAEHVARNGNIYSDDDPPPDRPGELPFCGCTSRAVLVIDGEVIG